MNYEKRVVAFIDILGFKDEISSTIDSKGVPDENKIDILEDALLEVQRILEPEPGWVWRIRGHRNEPSLMITQFSDSIAFSIRADDPSEVFHSIHSLYWVPVQLMQKASLTCRGGIAYGYVRHTESVLFGPAVIQAYRLESTAAHYPRILIHPDVYSILDEKRQEILQFEGLRIEDIILPDSDGLHYINYFKLLPNVFIGGEWNEYQENLRHAIKKGLQSPDPNILSKYMWMNSKIQSF